MSGLLFATAAIILLVAVFETATQTLEEQMVASAQTDARTIARFLREGAIDDIIQLAARTDRDGDFRRMVIDGSGQVVIDQIGLKARTTGAVAIGAAEIGRALTGPNPFEDSGLIGFGLRQADGSYILVAQEDEQLFELRQALVQTVAGAVLAIMLLAILGGILVSYLILRRLDRFNAVAGDVTSGRMARRMPVSPRADEFDRLAIQLNAMLDQLEASMDALKQVSSDIAHDLRTPLTRLKQRLEEIAVELQGRPHRSLVTQALREADNMLEVFASLLRISQIEAGAARANFAPVDLSGILQELAEIYEAVAADGMRSLTASITPAVIVNGDRALLQQLFTNLIENALTHTPAGSKIALELIGTGASWQAIVADDGPGIPPSARDKVFDRFFRLEKSRTTPGTGLGLSLVQAIALAHGFSISVEDNKPGSRFVIAVSKA